MSNLLERSGFDLGGLGFEPDIKSAFISDYWEECNIASALAPEPGIKLSQTKRNKNSNKVSDGPKVSASGVAVITSDPVNFPKKEIEEDAESFVEPPLPYCFCFCCRTATPFVVWIFIGISIIFFQMGAIVTGRWISISDSSWDEVVYYAAFSVCLAFATFYFRHGTRHHNPFDLMFLVMTVPIMWVFLTVTTVLFKQDTFFYVGSVMYTIFSGPYMGVGFFITIKFWTHSKLFHRRVDGKAELEPMCRKLFFAISYLTFDMQLTLCACIISMAPSVNQGNRNILITSIVFAPFFVGVTLLWFVVGYFAMRKENRILTWLFTVLSGNQILLVIGLLIKRPIAVDLISKFINAAMLGSIGTLLTVHISLLVFIWKSVVPNYGKGLRRALKRTAGNSCIQCAEITICH